MLVPSCNSGRFLSPGSIEDRSTAYCEKILKGTPSLEGLGFGERVRGARVSRLQTTALTRDDEATGCGGDAMDFDEIARQAEEMVAAGQQADTEAVQKLANTLNISPELAEYLLALEVRIRKLEGI
jgi:hypothetical protein